LELEAEDSSRLAHVDGNIKLNIGKGMGRPKSESWRSESLDKMGRSWAASAQMLNLRLVCGAPQPFYEVEF